MSESLTPDSASTDTTELAEFLAAYRPRSVPAENWNLLADDATTLVLRAGAATRLRVEKDIQFIGAVVAHLIERGRPLTLEEVLTDATLLSYDTSLESSDKTRENKRGIARRLQAVHRGLPWRAQRRAPGGRTQAMVPHTELSVLRRIIRKAEATSDDAEAVAFLTAIAAVRASRSDAGSALVLSPTTWSRARRFADRNNWHVTQPRLKAIATHEVLSSSEPVGALIARYGLSRRDLDLALTRAADLPAIPDSSDHDLLRGAV